ncbi:MAG: sigma-70 family RNA polymerase sigma factor [Rubrivivax sp.]|nr:sigma-70 family RNA polymerase sigma factor [Rubrivivax sp.]
MKSLQDIPSALVARNESWVRQQAGQLMRRLPSNVEKADLIQVGLIAVAQAAVGFRWEGDAESAEGRDAFVRYARSRVRGAMLDELRQMDHLVRSDRRKFKALEIARERWLSLHGRQPTLGELSTLTQLPLDEIARLEQAALAAQTESLDADDERPERARQPEPATPADEVEARVDTDIVLRRLAGFFKQLPERERQVIEAYLGIGLAPGELAGQLQVSPSRVTQLYRAAVRRMAQRLGLPDARATARHARGAALDALVRERESSAASWGPLLEQALGSAGRIEVDAGTRWG